MLQLAGSLLHHQREVRKVFVSRNQTWRRRNWDIDLDQFVCTLGIKPLVSANSCWNTASAKCAHTDAWFSRFGHFWSHVIVFKLCISYFVSHTSQKKGTFVLYPRSCSLSKGNIYFVVRGKPHAGQNKCALSGLCSRSGTSFLVYLVLLCGPDLNNTWGRCHCGFYLSGAKDFPFFASETCCLTFFKYEWLKSILFMNSSSFFCPIQTRMCIFLFII